MSTFDDPQLLEDYENKQVDFEESYIQHTVSSLVELMETHGVSYILNMVYDEYYKKASIF